MKRRVIIGCLLLTANFVFADTIRGINIDFVTIGNAGNAGDTRNGAYPYNCGAVSSSYRIGKYEVTAAQWQTINTAAGIGDSGIWSGNQPVAGISWYDAAQFCNYLTSGNKYSGAYKFDISGIFQEIDRVSSISTYGTTYVIPTENEWYKAAYYKHDGSGYSTYANGTNTAPVAGVNSNYNGVMGYAPWTITNGTPEQNGTFDMMGNVWEWNETLISNISGSYRGIRGGSYGSASAGRYLASSNQNNYYGPGNEDSGSGFRVASVPEPASLLLLALGGMLIRKRLLILEERKMKRTLILSIIVFVSFTNLVSADTFGSGANQFTIDFVPISGNLNPTSGIPAGDGFTFTGVTNDYRMGKFEITNDQWNKFKASYGTVTGSPSNTYASDSYWTGTNVPTNNVCWYEAAQFVNFLNTSKGYQAAYKFTGTQGTRDYTMAVWEAGDSGYNMSNPYRNGNAFYFLPTENEWVKAAYWNGTSLQTYATKAGETLFQGNGSNGGWNYDRNTVQQPWNVGSGSQELNGTFDMMGNVWEWMESPYNTGNYLSDSYRGVRGGAYSYYYPGNGDGDHDSLVSSNRDPDGPLSENIVIGFRVASEIPEPASLLLLSLGSILAIRKKKPKT